MFNIIVIVELVISVFLMAAILMQSSKGGGLAGSFGGGTMGTVFGVRRTADFLSKTTSILATIFIGLCLLANMFFLPSTSKNAESIIQRGTPTTVIPPRAPQSIPAATEPSSKPK